MVERVFLTESYETREYDVRREVQANGWRRWAGSWRRDVVCGHCAEGSMMKENYHRAQALSDPCVGVEDTIPPVFDGRYN